MTYDQNYHCYAFCMIIFICIEQGFMKDSFQCNYLLPSLMIWVESEQENNTASDGIFCLWPPDLFLR